jgi:hypothetical protein
VYGLGVVVFVSRLVIGWRAMRRVARASRPVVAVEGPVYESAAIATPLTLGVFRPRVVLPTAWTTWPEETRLAVLAHERAHLRRRDPLISALAHVNRCVFWFHPLAWWLERTLAATAEEACDDAGVRAVGEPRRYAEVLIAVADAVRHRGGRVAWQGLGVNGTGFLSQRIDRVLHGNLSPAVSWPQRVGVAMTCAIAIVLAVACRQQAALERDPAVTLKMAQEKARGDAFRAKDHEIETMTADQAAAIEASLTTNPDDVEARRKLLDYYDHTLLRTEPERWVLARRPHALWLIEHRPEAAETKWVRFYPTDGKTADPIGYEEARKLWLAHAARPDVSAEVLRRAVAQLQQWDAPKAEELLLRGQALKLVDPDRPDASWSSDLGSFYATVLARDAGAYVPFASKPPYDPHAYALAVRRKLAGSADSVLLTAAGSFLLTMWSHGTSGGAELRDLGQACLNHVLQIDPQSKAALGALATLPTSEREVRLSRFFNQTQPVPTADQLAVLTDVDRFWLLPRLAKWTEMRANEAAYAQARQFARDALALAPKFTASPDYAPSVFIAHMTLGLLAVRANQRPDAVEHLLAASTLSPPDDLHVFDVQHNLLLVALLKDNERDAVVTFLERMAKHSTSERDTLLDSAAKIRKGLMPEWYQRVIGPS